MEKNRLFSCVGGPWLQPRDQPGAEPGQVRQRAGPGVHPGLQDPLLEGGHDRLQGVPGQHRENGTHISIYTTYSYYYHIIIIIMFTIHICFWAILCISYCLYVDFINTGRPIIFSLPNQLLRITKTYLARNMGNPVHICKL